MMMMKHDDIEHLRFRQKVVYRAFGGAEARCASFSSIGTAVLELLYPSPVKIGNFVKLKNYFVMMS